MRIVCDDGWWLKTQPMPCSCYPTTPLSFSQPYICSFLRVPHILTSHYYSLTLTLPKLHAFIRYKSSSNYPSYFNTITSHCIKELCLYKWYISEINLALC